MNLNMVHFSIPLLQWMTALVLSCICLLFARYRIGVLIIYFFCLYWGYISNMKVLVAAMGGNMLGFSLFILIGFGLSALGLFFLMQKDFD